MWQVLNGGVKDTWLLELLKVLPTALVAAVVGGCTIYIGWRQYVLAKEAKEVAAAKLKLDLFEERYKVFEEVWKTLSDIFILGAKFEDLPAFTPPLNQYLPKLHFLFGQDVEVFIDTALKNWKELLMIDARIKMNHDLVPPGDVQTLHDLQLWFGHAAIQCKEVFARYMNFDKWQG